MSLAPSPQAQAGAVENLEPDARTATLNSALLFGTLLGGALLVNSFIASWTYESHLGSEDQIISGLAGMLGAILLSAPVFMRALRAILSGKRDLGELAALAVFACFAIGEYREAGIMAFLLLIAELIEERTAAGAHTAVENLLRLTPEDAHLIEAGGEREVSVKSLKPGQLIRVRPGESIPVDGVLRGGQSTIDQSMVTGESLPIDVVPGRDVFAGTINLTGLVEVEVTKVGGDTTLGRVQDMILEAERTRLPILRLIDRYISWYTPTVIMIAALIFYFTKDIYAAITALIVGCPCAIVLATPTAMVAGLTCAARFGILIKTVAHLELAGQIDAVVFDKTGTLTTGHLTVARLAPTAGVAAADFVRLAASADRYSNHPAARALVKVAKEAQVGLVEPLEFLETGGKGVSAKIDGHAVLVGRKSWLIEQTVSMAGVATQSHTEEDGYSYLYVARDGECVGWVAMVDQPRPEAKRAMAELKELGMGSITMLTGDRWAVAQRVATELGCTEVVAECLPETKLKYVEAMKKRGLKVAVVGDGVNDAPALAAGDLGVAMGAAGNDIAIHSASIALMSNDISRLPLLVRLSRRVRGTVAVNLSLGVVIILFGLIAAGVGLLSPISAAIFQNIGSFVVIFNSARLVRFGEEITPLQAD